MDEDNEAIETPDRMFHLARVVFPWLILSLLGVVLFNIGGDFMKAQRAASILAQVSAETSASAGATSTASVVTSGTAYIAKVQTEVSLMSRADATSEKIATAKVGATLTVLTTQKTWLRVKDAAGHIGWIPNDTKYVTLQVKTK